MTIHYSQKGRTVTAWLERKGVRIAEASGNSLEMAIGRLVYAFSQGDDPAATPRIRVVEG
jgi:hypothetical protein